MVRVSFGQKVAAAIALFVTASILFAWRAQLPKPQYIAQDDSSDLVTVDGIVRADTHATTTYGTVRAVVVPHHLVAAEAIARGIKYVASSSPRLVVLVSPDHFGRCKTLACTTYGSYETFFGTVSISDDAVFRALSRREIFSTSDLFSKEHGVYAIVPFIKHYAPNAKILPIALSQRGVGTKESREELVVFFRDILTSDAVLVISSDFSHYLPLKESDRMDAKTQSAFCRGSDTDSLELENPSQSDCPLCLWLLRTVAEKSGYWNPVRIWHSNSARLMRDETVQETTSHFVFLLPDAKFPGRCEGPLE